MTTLIKGVSCKPEKKYFKCEFCDQLLVVEVNRKQHVKIFHADKLEGKAVVYTCTLCGYKVADESYFYEHKFKCTAGKKSADNATLIKVGFGQRLEGQLDDMLECEKCAAKFEGEDAYQNHVSTCCQIVKSENLKSRPVLPNNVVKITFGQFKAV